MFLNVQRIESSCNPLSNLSAHIRVAALEKAVPFSAIEQALKDTHKEAKRERKLNSVVTVLLVIAMNLFVNDSIGYVLLRLCKGLRLLQFLKSDHPDYSDHREPGKRKSTKPNVLSDEDAHKGLRIPGDSALVYRRYQVGVRPLHSLFRALCRPLAMEGTPKAFLFGLRLMGIDGLLLRN